MTDSNILINDHKEKSINKFDLSAALKQAAALHGTKPLSIVADWWRLKKKGGALSFEEYFQYRLYDPSYTNTYKESFISENLHWDFTDAISDPSWKAATEDKWLSYEILEKFGFSTPKTIAVADRSIRQYGQCPKISNATDFKDFIESVQTFPIFAKPNKELGSFGAFLIDQTSDDQLLIDGVDTKSVEEVYTMMIEKTDYIFQEFIENHTKIAKYAKYVATVRTVNMVDKERIITPFTVFKIPTSGNIADNYWRDGNLLANIDTNTGEILRVVSGAGLSLKEHDVHPETGDNLVGETLPFWHELLDLNNACARSFSPVRYQSLDIAITNNGPIVVEINTGGSFFLPQLAAGDGLMTEEVQTFFDDCDWKRK